MNHHRPYRPFSTYPHTYGVCLQPCTTIATGPCAPTGCVCEWSCSTALPPLKGLWKARATAVSYRASVPAGHYGCGLALSYRALAPHGERQPVPAKAQSNRSSVPTKALSNQSTVSTTAPPFRHTPCRFWPQEAPPVWRNLRQHPRFNDTFTFSAKERDPETGLSYFGSRYYSSDLSIWLSVDPMSDKYASLSPYVYCADNPVRCVDPNGEEVYIIGDVDNKNALVNILSNYFENIKVGYDEETGKLKIVKGTAQTDDEIAFANAVNDTKIQVNLEIGDSQNTGRKTSNGEDLIVEGAGGFLGNTISYNSKEHTKENIVKVYTSQYLSIDAMERLYYEKDWGKLINHEITESFQGGLISSTTNVPGRNENGVINSDIYNQAHAAATPQPFTIGASWLHH